MKTKKRSTKNTEPRKVYTLDDKAKAKKYYLIGLSLIEVGKLTDTPARTLEKWYLAENWKSQKEISKIELVAFNMFESGKTYKEIASELKIGIATVYRYIKAVRNENKSK